MNDVYFINELGEWETISYKEAQAKVLTEKDFDWTDKMFFSSIEEAFEWMEDEIDDPCIDSHRVYKWGDAEAENTYNAILEGGCCGFFDFDFMIGDDTYSMGCNFGH